MTVEDFNLFVPPGHFYSPIVDNQSLGPLLGYDPIGGEIELNLANQLSLLSKISSLGLIFPKNKELSCRYYSNNDQYAEGDAFILSGLIKYLKPKKIIEIGSGYSSAVVLETIEEMDTKFTLIEPFTERLLSLINSEDDVEIIEDFVQNVDVSIFEDLGENDILFIDSSHVGKSNSDVLWELFKILPRLNSGVWIHFHDQFWPFEYPEAWVRGDNRSWNELYFLRAFLAYNKKFSIQLFPDFLVKMTRDWDKYIPHEIVNHGGALWLLVNEHD